MKTASSLAVLAWFVAEVTACSTGNDVASKAGPDATADAPLDAPAEGATDASIDATSDASVDAPIDVAIDAGATIHGRVILPLWDGMQYEWVPAFWKQSVRVRGLPPVVTDTGGNFTIDGVTVPYDVTVYSVLGVATTYVGLTRLDPIVAYHLEPGYGVAVPYQATFGGALSGLAWQTGASDPAAQVSVTFASSETQRLAGLESSYAGTPAAATYGETAYWFGPTSTTGTVRALSWGLDASSNITAYSHGERAGVTLTDGGDAEGQSVTLSPIASASLRGTMTLPIGFTPTQQTLRVKFADGSSSATTIPACAGATDFTCVAPSGLVGATLEIDTTATAAGGASLILQTSGLAPNATGVAVTGPAAPTLSTPADAATDLDPTTTFAWSPVSGAVHRLQVLVGGASVAPFVYDVFTSADSATVPDFTAIGLGFDPSTAVRWTVTAYGPLTSVDDLAGGAPLPTGAATFQAQSASRTATTRAGAAPPRGPTEPLTVTVKSQGPTQLVVTWSSDATGQTGFEIDRCATADCSDDVTLTTLGPTATSYLDGAVTTGTRYWYRVIATNAYGFDGNQGTCIAGAPAPPTSFTDTIAKSPLAVTLTWAPGSTDQAGFLLERSGGGVGWTTVATPAATATSFTDTGVASATSYVYRLRATNTYGASNPVTVGLDTGT